MSDIEIGWTLMGVAAVFGALIGFGLSAWLSRRATTILRWELDKAREGGKQYAKECEEYSGKYFATRYAYDNLRLRMAGMMERDPATGRLRKVQL